VDELLERIASALERIAGALESLPAPSARAEWNSRRVEAFLSMLRDPGWRVLKHLHQKFPESCSSHEIVSAGIVDGARAISPVTVAVARIADAFDLPSPIEVKRAKYPASATYTLRPEFHAVWKPT